jgi:hypothetical protein
MTEPITPDLPAPTKHAADIAKLTTGVAAAVASIWFPPAAIAAAVLPIVIDRYVNRPRDLLIRPLERGEIRDVSAEQFAPFVPMAYKFMEAVSRPRFRSGFVSEASHRGVTATAVRLAVSRGRYTPATRSPTAAVGRGDG